MGLNERKPVFGVSDKARLKTVYSATESRISSVASLDILSEKRITKVLISLRGCLGFSVVICTFVVCEPRRQVFSR